MPWKSATRAVHMAPVLVLASWLAVGCESHETLPNVLIVTLDTVRADHIGCYGYERNTSPHLDALAARADRYANAWATSPWTLPSHASLFTGRFPFEHGAHRRPWKGGRNTNIAGIRDGVPRLTEVFWSLGHRTAAFVANAGYLRPHFGIEDGFDVYEVEHVRGVDINARALAWLDGLGEREPFFLFVNYMDAHAPYNTEPVAGSGLPGASDDEELLARLGEAVMEQGREADDLARRVRAQYDLGIANADAALGALLDALARRDRLDDTVVVVASDHGEFFGEHSIVAHSKDVYEPVLRIPLVVKHPRQRRGNVIETPASLVDVAALVVGALPEAERQHWAASFPHAPATHPILAESHYTMIKDLVNPVYGDRFDRVRIALYENEWKLIHSSDGEHELFDLSHDVGEQADLYDAQPSEVHRLSERMIAILGDDVGGERAPAGAPLPELSDELLDQLEALGYR